MNEKVCLLASTNENKLKEVREILGDFGFTVINLNDLDNSIDVVEDGHTFSENAGKKARAYHEIYPDYYILTDDSGLSVDALGGRPGIYSARYAGTDSDYETKFNMLWKELGESGVEPENWTAKFVCAIAWWDPNRDMYTIFTGEMNGVIIDQPRGENGFGYDPIFYLPNRAKTSAELDPVEKNRISHRGRALRKLKHYLDK